MTAPIDVVLQRIPSARKTARGWSGRCGAHDDRGPSLSIAVGAEGRVVLHCFAGCSVEAIVAAIGLEVRDLFPSSDGLRRERVQRNAVRSVYRRAPRRTFEAFTVREIERQRTARLKRQPFDTPEIRSVDVNAARARAATLFELRLEPIASYAWEGFEPHDRDPAWPHLFARAIEEESWRWHHFWYPTAAAWETGVLPERLYWHAADIAARWLHAFATLDESKRGAA